MFQNRIKLLLLEYAGSALKCSAAQIRAIASYWNLRRNLDSQNNALID